MSNDTQKPPADLVAAAVRRRELRNMWSDAVHALKVGQWVRFKVRDAAERRQLQSNIIGAVLSPKSKRRWGARRYTTMSEGSTVLWVQRVQ